MNKVALALISLTITAGLLVVMHDHFMRPLEASNGTASILIMETIAVLALILAFTLGHILDAVKILTGEQRGHLSVEFEDIVKILFTVGASGAIYLGLLELFKRNI